MDISHICISWEKEDIKVAALSFIVISYLGFGQQVVLEMREQENKQKKAPQISLLDFLKHLQGPKSSVVLTTNLDDIMKLTVSREIKGWRLSRISDEHGSGQPDPKNKNNLKLPTSATAAVKGKVIPLANRWEKESNNQTKILCGDASLQRKAWKGVLEMFQHHQDKETSMSCFFKCGQVN